MRFSGRHRAGRSSYDAAAAAVEGPGLFRIASVINIVLTVLCLMINQRRQPI